MIDERPHYLAPLNCMRLNRACAHINDAFEGSVGIFLVGSAMQRRDYRDVDVRLMLRDEAYDPLFRRDGDPLDAFWSLLCGTIGAWLSAESGLPIDFQIQRMSDANARYPGSGHRNALGIFLGYPGELPSTLDGDTGGET